MSVSFDLDGTLTDLAFADAVWNEGVPGLLAERRGIDIDDARRICARAYAAEGDSSMAWYSLTHWLERLQLGDVDRDILIERFTGRIHAYEDALCALESLRGLGIQLVLFSNAGRCFLDREIEHAGIGGFFDRVVSLPDDWKTLKANPESFVRLKGLVGGFLMHVGDHAIFDYEVPMSVGVRACHVWRGRGVRLADSIETLDHLADRIARGQIHP